ncbi:MAG: hypothetical protein WCK34_09195 [Bacteroidota bacterium]
MAEPKEETPEELIRFLEKHKFPTDGMYMFSDSGSYFQAMRNPLFVKSFLSHMNFNRQGMLLMRDTTQCQWSGKDVIKSLHPDSTYTTLPGLKLDQILRHITPFGKDQGKDTLMQNPDFTVIVTWGKFIGEYNYRLFSLSSAVKENKSAAIRLIWLNVDIQQDWHLTKKQKPSFK